MENRTNGVGTTGIEKEEIVNFKEKMIRKVLESKALQTVLDFIVGGKSITTDTDVVIDVDMNFQSLEAVEKKEYNDEGRLTLSSQQFNGDCKLTFTIKGKGSYTLERK